MRIISATDFPLFYSNAARKCLILRQNARSKIAYSARNSAGRIYPSPPGLHEGLDVRTDIRTIFLDA